MKRLKPLLHIRSQKFLYPLSPDCQLLNDSQAKSPLPEKFSSGKEYDANGGIPETTTSTIGERAKARAAAKERHIMAGRRTDGKGIAVKKRKSITSSDEEVSDLKTGSMGFAIY
jgi:hypothetical protein